jgi:hypothetical protein
MLKTTTNETNFFILAIILLGKYIGKVESKHFSIQFLGLHEIWICLLVWNNLLIGYN